VTMKKIRECNVRSLEVDRSVGKDQCMRRKSYHWRRKRGHVNIGRFKVRRRKKSSNPFPFVWFNASDPPNGASAVECDLWLKPPRVAAS
jgi:hypothetical protein